MRRVQGTCAAGKPGEPGIVREFYLGQGRPGEPANVREFRENV